MRVLSTLTYYYPHWTGLTAYAQRIAEGLVRRGHTVKVLTTRASPELAESERHNGVDIVRLRPIAHLSRGVIVPGLPATLRRLIGEHDIVQFHTPMLEAWLVTGFAQGAGKPALMTHHGDVVMPRGVGNQLVERAVTALMSRACAGATRIAIHSEDYATHSRFLRPFRDKHVYIHPPVEIPVPDRGAALAWKRELGLHGPVVGFAGRFVEEKGFDFLFRAIPFIRREMPAVGFVFAGEIDVVYERFFDRARAWLPEDGCVKFLGLQRDPQRLAQFYAMSDVLAVPSRTDCFPSVQPEAMLCGTPVVTADIPGAREAVRLTGMGRLTRPGDPEALAGDLLQVLRAPKDYHRPREVVRAVFDCERAVGQYEALLESMLSDGAGRRRHGG